MDRSGPSRPVDDDIPDELRLVRAFLNTLDVEDAVDHLASISTFATWLADQGLIDPAAVAAGQRITRQELAAALDLRLTLRWALLAPIGGRQIEPTELRRLNTAVAKLVLVVRFDSEGVPRVMPRGDGIGAVLARIVGDVAVARSTGTWSRLKVCPAEDCLWVFYDHSKNRSRRWCSMGLCGNRTKTRSYRRRRTGSDGQVSPVPGVGAAEVL